MMTGELKPMNFKDAPISAELELSPETQTFKKVLGCWSQLLCKKLWDFWSSIPGNFTDFWSLLFLGISDSYVFFIIIQISSFFQYSTDFLRIPSMYNKQTREHDQTHAKAHQEKKRATTLHKAHRTHTHTIAHKTNTHTHPTTDATHL